MGAKSDYLENKHIDHTLRGIPYTAPSTVYVGLFSSALNDAGGGTEISGGSYARVAVPANAASWAGTQSAGSTSASSGVSGTTSNNIAITFPAPTANWGTVSHGAIFDAASGGNLLYYLALTLPKTVNNGDAAPSFPAGSLTVQEDN